MKVLDGLRDLIASAMGGKAPGAVSVAEAQRVVQLLDEQLTAARINAAQAKRTEQDFLARAAFEKPAADKVIGDATAKATAAEAAVAAIESALVGAHRVLAAAQRRQDRAALEVWGQDTRDFVERRGARFLRAHELSTELAALAAADAAECGATWRALPAGIRDRLPELMFSRGALARAVLRHVTAASGGAFAGVAMMPREFEGVLAEAFDRNAIDAGALLAMVAAELGEVEGQPEAAKAA